ncbi:MAG: TonB-dependent receptor [Candidatus Marinimicrobia bacterium]|nr:TonB-dependent receptor [Candidatus Neomarinimicrobiota bacterium]
MIRHLLHCLSITVLVLSLSAEFTKAGTTGKIKGNVTDSDTGEPLVGANVVLVGSGLGAATDNEGNFFILNIPPGNYRVRASVIGYQSVEMTSVRVNVDLTTSASFELSTQDIEAGETVTVIATRPMIRMDGTATATQISADELNSAPIETVQEMVATKAGVTVDAGGALHIRGGRSDEISYIVDGMPNINPFDNSQGIEIATNAIAEISVLTGSFNAEYGRALSGVINMVTKDGKKNYTGSFSFQGGDMLSNYDIEINETIRNEVKSYEPKNLSEFEATLGGPIPSMGDKLTFYTSGRWFEREGTLFGLRLFDNEGIFIRTGLETDLLIVPMNPLKRINFQGKLKLNITSNLRLQYSFLSEDAEWQNYASVTDHRRKFVPDGRLQFNEEGRSHVLKLTHQLNSKTFYTLIASNFENNYSSYAYENPFDERYVWSGFDVRDVNYEFNVAGTQNGHVRRESTTNDLKFDFSSQINNKNEIKFGINIKKLRLFQHDFVVEADRLREPYNDLNNNGICDGGELLNDLNGNGICDVSDENNDGIEGNIIIGSFLNNNLYEHNPTEFSTYFQDKIELRDMVINVGFRYDFFEPDGVVPNDLKNPDPNNVRKATSKSQISPRFSMAYPISDRGKLYFSYGRFFQLPPYSRLYANPDFEVRTGTIGTTIGNADIDPQQTTSYELGMEQQLSDDVAAYLKIFFKDFRNLLGQQRFKTDNRNEYVLFINRSYGEVKGVTFTLDKRFSTSFSSSVDYTYQIAQGNQSDPTASLRNFRLSIEEAKQVVFLNWDQTHALRINTLFSKPGSWGIGLSEEWRAVILIHQRVKMK